MTETKQLGVLRYIYEKQNEKGYPPTVREIGEAVGLSSTSTVHGHIERLEKHGLLHKDPTKPRAIEITEKGLRALGVPVTPGKVPVIGIVTAGIPILAVEQNATEFLPLPDDLERFEGDLFVLRVSGTSMINIGILDGDMVFVRKQDYADNGDIVVAMTSDFGNGEGEATVKRFFKEAGHYRLQPENDTMAPIIVHNVAILGKVVGLYRNSIY
ncbi:transcriptional repressor LexA [Oenococcus kitaharae]|uniref:LexA repressor n=1 Tax=Oenococcus kitaharae DSM 17330 TaxID=1045004 RepID=G9WH72_9LACO|nr:transcriptional repressor LexA [Oenococcus kitaharae]EHN59561.1 SOS-response repressor and protease LexA [Oenococcus kitaharae DSM 17330]OEY83414.1 LexA family transcriptional regulator [Oenococcus kitaharae]OEY85213.1 LexA family transcriptional regulator [Oenococcus kitaharae]OEY86067.1 LexA family transcriptional regulator [Oenococcus kitaharae]